MTKTAISIEEATELFPVRFDITTENDATTKDIQALIQFQEGERLDLRLIRKRIYERGVDTYRSEIAKIRQVA